MSLAFRYRALGSNGMVAQGEIEARSREEVAAALMGQGLFALEVERRAVAPAAGRGLPASDLAIGLRQLSSLLDAGLPVERALAAFAEAAPAGWRRCLPRIRRAITNGAGLGAAFADSDGCIPPVTVGLLGAGEATGSLAGAVARAATVAESQATSQAAVRQALLYPAILLGAGLASLLFLTLVVLPRFAMILADLGQELPGTTRLVLAWATLAQRAWLPGIVLVVGSLVAWHAWQQSDHARVTWHQILLELPIVGPLRHSLATARAADAMGALLQSGLTLPRALEHGAAASGDAAVREAVLASREAVLTGTLLSRALTDTQAMTSTAVRLVRTGEESGQLGRMLSEAGRIEAATSERRIQAGARLIEPVFILAFGAVIALVAAALLQALYAVRPV